MGDTLAVLGCAGEGVSIAEVETLQRWPLYMEICFVYSISFAMGSCCQAQKKKILGSLSLKRSRLSYRNLATFGSCMNSYCSFVFHCHEGSISEYLINDTT